MLGPYNGRLTEIIDPNQLRWLGQVLHMPAYKALPRVLVPFAGKVWKKRQWLSSNWSPTCTDFCKYRCLCYNEKIVRAPHNCFWELAYSVRISDLRQIRDSPVVLIYGSRVST